MAGLEKGYYKKLYQEIHYTEYHREDTEDHRGIFAISRFRYFPYRDILLRIPD
jgi:hypothetical protein